MSYVYADQIADFLPDGWSIRPFEEMVFFQEGPGIRNWQYVPKGIPFVNIRCLVDGRLDRSAMSHISEEEALGKYKHFLLDPKDYVVSSSGTLGRIATVENSDLPCMLNTSVIRMRPRGADLDRRFLKYFLISHYYQSQILSFATGSAQLNYGPMHLRQMFIVTPPLPEQRAIAHILGTLDDKIE
uniref:restriction endonuclease subunit S n=1 Tax=Acidithiobacillus sp. TaxID=1872118 RepID=UPI0025B7F014